MSGQKKTYITLILINGGLMHQKIILSDLMSIETMENLQTPQPILKVSEKRIFNG